MIEKASIVQEQFKLTIPKDIRDKINIKVGTVAKWITEQDSLETNTLVLKFINV